uniref:Uncharacterized protein n=1 Tax=Babesia duncani TaxID=323732 RepID=A0A385GNL6_9APIC|nr:hypothetical protein [Babesia duncani]
MSTTIIQIPEEKVLKHNLDYINLNFILIYLKNFINLKKIFNLNINKKKDKRFILNFIINIINIIKFIYIKFFTKSKTDILIDSIKNNIDKYKKILFICFIFSTLGLIFGNCLNYLLSIELSYVLIIRFIKLTHQAISTFINGLYDPKTYKSNLYSAIVMDLAFNDINELIDCMGDKLIDILMPDPKTLTFHQFSFTRGKDFF